MKPQFLLSLVAFAAIEGYSQSGPTVISAAGGSGTTENVAIEWTIGEPISGSGSGTSMLLTQGFEQPVLLVVEPTVPVIAPVASTKFSVFPNPANAVLNVRPLSTLNGRVVISLVDLNGNVLISKQANSANELQQIDISRLAPATYLLRITNIYGAVISASRIVKVK